MRLEGYIEFKNENYTFVYDNDYLTMINCDVNKTSSPWNKREKVDYFEGITVSGYQVSFFVDGFVNSWYSTYRCTPKIVFVSKISGIDFFKEKMETIKFSGGVIDRFYSNSQILENKTPSILDNKKIEFKDINNTVKKEAILINGSRATFEMSVGYPGWKYDGTIKFNDITSNLRIRYSKKKKYKEFIKDILLINNLFFFCMNRRQQNYGTIVLEATNLKFKKLEPLVEIYIPTGEENKYNPRFMIRYDDISGNVSKLLKLLSNLKYSTYMIPKDEKEYRSVSATTYASAFSAYQSIYNYTHSTNGVVYDNKNFEEAKKEVVDAISSVAEKYKGKNSKKRKFVDSFAHIINQSQLKLENMVIAGIKEYAYMEDTLSDAKYKQIMFDIEDAVNIAVHDRDLITHSDVFAPTDIDMAVYLLIERITYAMILNKIGMKKKDIKDITKHLSVVGII